jgi:hypothetical protein
VSWEGDGDGSQPSPLAVDSLHPLRAAAVHPESLPLQSMGKPLTLIAAGLLALPTAAAAAETWHEEPAVATLFQQAGVVGTFVLLNESRGELPGCNQARAEQRFSPASTFKIPNSLIGLSLGAVSGVMSAFPAPVGPNPS